MVGSKVIPGPEVKGKLPKPVSTKRKVNQIAEEGRVAFAFAFVLFCFAFAFALVLFCFAFAFAFAFGLFCFCFCFCCACVLEPLVDAADRQHADEEAGDVDRKALPTRASHIAAATHRPAKSARHIGQQNPRATCL